MTLYDLHNIPKFAELFTDPRFIALLHYEREHIGKSAFDSHSHAEAMIFRGAHKDGWLDCINDMQERVNPPRPEAEKKDGRLYSERPR